MKNPHDLIGLLEAQYIECDTTEGNQVSQQRQRNHGYYALDALGNERPNRSKYVSADVLDSVESMKAYFQEAMMSGRRVMHFAPEHEGDKGCDEASEYAENALFELNDGFNLIRDSLHDAFVAKRCVAHVDWKEDIDSDYMSFQGVSDDQLKFYATKFGAENVVIDSVDVVDSDQGQSLSNVTIVQEEDRSQQRVKLIQPEKFFRDPRATYINDSIFAGHAEDVTRHQLIEDGFLEDEVMGLRLDYRFRHNEEEYARKGHDSSFSRLRPNKRSPLQEEVTLYTTYTYIDLQDFPALWEDVLEELPDELTGSQLYKFCWSQGELLTLEGGFLFEPVSDGMPYLEWTQIKISHSEFGLCESDIQAGMQFNKSNLTRLILDNQQAVNTTRWKARKGVVRNPRELLENNIGSTIWLNDINGLEPIETPQLSPATFQVLDMLGAEKEARGGLSRLAKGMSGDAISHQNADSMIQRLTNASNRRVMMQVRDYANNFLRPLFVRLYNLGVKYDKRVHHTESQGKTFELRPSDWEVRRRMKVKVALTPDQAREWGIFLLQLHQVLVSDEDLGHMYGAQEKYDMITDIIEFMGISDNTKYLSSPDSEAFIAAKKREAIMVQEQKKTQEMLQQLQIKLEMSEDARKWFESRLKAIETHAEIGETGQRMGLEFERDARERVQESHERLMDVAELAIEREQKRPAEIG